MGRGKTGLEASNGRTGRHGFRASAGESQGRGRLAASRHGSISLSEVV